MKERERQARCRASKARVSRPAAAVSHPGLGANPPLGEAIAGRIVDRVLALSRPALIAELACLMGDPKRIVGHVGRA